MICYFLYGQKLLSVSTRAALFVEAPCHFRKKTHKGSEELWQGLVEQRHSSLPQQCGWGRAPGATLGLGAMTLRVAEGSVWSPRAVTAAWYLPHQPERAAVQHQPQAATGTWAPVGERRAGGVRLCSPAPSGAGVGAGPRVPCEQHRMAGHCALCCKRPLHRPYSRGQAVMNKDMPETLARGGVLRDRQGTGCSPVGGACPGR